MALTDSLPVQNLISLLEIVLDPVSVPELAWMKKQQDLVRTPSNLDVVFETVSLNPLILECFTRQEAENQRRPLRAFVKGHEGWKLVEEYRDEESGATGSRARFQALFEDAHQRKFEVLVFWALDRFSRQGTRATINYLHELESYGVGFVSYTEAIWTRPGIFRDALIGLLAALAKQERIRLSDRVKAGMARARIEGKHVGRPRLDDRTRRQVRELRQQKPDLSIRAIARETEVPYATTRRLLLEREKPPGN